MLLDGTGKAPYDDLHSCAFSHVKHSFTEPLLFRIMKVYVLLICESKAEEMSWKE